MTYASEVLADSPLAFWPCDDGSGSPQDASGNGNHASGGSTWYETDADLGTVLAEPNDFGVRNTATVALGTAAWTVEYVGKVAPGGYISAGSDGSPTDGVGSADLSELSGTLTFQGWWDDNAMSAPAPITASSTLTQDDIWHHIAATWDGTDLKLYVDGSLVDTVSCSGTWTPPADCGFGGTAAGDRLWGVAVYGTALSGARIAAHFAELPTFTPSEIVPPPDTNYDTNPVGVAVDALEGVAGNALTTVDGEVVTVDVDAKAGRFGQRTVPTPTITYNPTGGVAVWEVHSADMEGSTGLITTSDGRRGATCTEITKRMNDISFTVEIPPFEGSLSPIVDEVQVYRNGHLHAWGPVLPKNSDTSPGSKVRYGARDPSWYLERTVVGDPERVNFLENGSFEDEYDGWVKHGPCLWSIDTTYVARGEKAMRLTCADPEADAYIETSFVHDNTKAAYGYWYYAKAWAFVDDYIKAAKNTFGLWIRYTNGVVTRYAWSPINAATPYQQYFPLEAKVLGEPFSSGIVTLRLYAPQGDIVWDACQVVGNNFTGGTSTEGTDQALMAAELVRVAQFDPNKSDKKIGRSCPTTGKKYRGIFEHFKHSGIIDAVRTVLDHEDGADWWVDCTPTTRTFRTKYPRRGSTATDLVFDTGGNALHVNGSEDGSQAASAVIMQGPGDGPAREEGGAIDTSVFGGKILDAVYQADPEAPLSRLDQRARDQLARSKKIPRTITFKVAGDLVDEYNPGDTCNATVNWGAASFDGLVRVQEVKIYPPSDTADVTVTPWEEPE